MSFAARPAAIGTSGLVFLKTNISASSVTGTAPYIAVESGGNVVLLSGFSTTNFTWLLSGSASDYEVKFDIGNQNPSDFSGATVGSWLSLSSTRTWTYIGATGVVSPISALEIRKASPASLLASSNVTFFWNP